MAIVNNGTKNSLPSGSIPSGYTRPTVTTFTDFQYSRALTLSVLKSTVEAAAGSDTMAAIIANATIGITKQIDDILAADYLATATVVAFADLVSITNNFSGVTGTDAYLTNVAASYEVTVNLYVKAD